MAKSYDDLPDDSEEAFLVLEEQFREERDRQLGFLGERESGNHIYVDYMVQVIAAIEELALESKFSKQTPSVADLSYSDYLDFNRDVTHYLTALKIRRSRRSKGYSVRFDEATKKKLHHFLQQFRDEVGKLEIEQNKREAILKRVHDLERELDHARTRYDAFAAMVIDTAGVVGEAAGKLEPLRRIIDSMSRLIWGAKQDEQASLPAPAETKRIEGPKEKPPSSTPVDLDDEIPF